LNFGNFTEFYNIRFEGLMKFWFRKQVRRVIADRLLRSIESMSRSKYFCIKYQKFSYDAYNAVNYIVLLV
jgi:hypothetical protein